METDIWGKIFGDRGYISKDLFANLYQKGLQLITKLKKNMRNSLMHNADKILLNKRQLVESVFARIKLLGNFEHSRHRSVDNVFLHMIASLINCQLLPHKPQLKFHEHYALLTKVVKAIIV